MIIQTPFAGELCLAPELAILAALEAALATAVQVMIAAHPEIADDSVDAADFTIDVETAAALARRASELIAIVNRYRLGLLDPDACLF